MPWIPASAGMTSLTLARTTTRANDVPDFSRMTVLTFRG